MKLQNIFLLLFLFTLNLNAQTCHYESYRQSILEDYPARKKQIEAVEREVQAYLRNEHPLEYRTLISIPVVVHIVWRNEVQNISDAQVYAQLDVLNRDFRKLNENAASIPSEFKDLAADMEIEFCLVKETPDGQVSSGITRTKTTIENIGRTDALKSTLEGGQDAWNTQHYMNIWVAEMDKTLLGYASSPGIAEDGSDGVVINYRYFGLFENSKPYNLGRTLTHEVGHYLNLEHSFGSVFGVCENTDFVEDTPLQQFAYYGCPKYPQESCNTMDMTMNFMQLVDDRCMSMFTKGQKERIMATLATARKELLLNASCEKNDFIENDESILLFPNPAENILNFHVSSNQESSVIITLTNTLGQKCFQRKINTNEFYHLAAKSYLSSGLYFFQVFDLQGEQIKLTKKLIIDIFTI